MSALNSDRGCLSQNALYCLFSFPLIGFCPLSLSCPIICLAFMLLILLCLGCLLLLKSSTLFFFSCSFMPPFLLSVEGMNRFPFLFCITLSEGNTDRGSERDLTLTMRDDFRMKCWMCISVKREIKYFDWELGNWSARFAVSCTAVCTKQSPGGEMSFSTVQCQIDCCKVISRLFHFLPLWHQCVCLINPKRKWQMKPCGFKTTCTIAIPKYYLLVCVNLYKQVCLCIWYCKETGERFCRRYTDNNTVMQKF